MGDDDGELEEDARLLDELTALSCRVAGRAPRLRRLLRGRIREGGAGEAVADLKVLAAAVEELMEAAEDEKKEQGKAAAAPVGVCCVCRLVNCDGPYRLSTDTHTCTTIPYQLTGARVRASARRRGDAVGGTSA